MRAGTFTVLFTAISPMPTTGPDTYQVVNKYVIIA